MALYASAKTRRPVVKDSDFLAQKAIKSNDTRDIEVARDKK